LVLTYTNIGDYCFDFFPPEVGARDFLTRLFSFTVVNLTILAVKILYYLLYYDTSVIII